MITFNEWFNKKYAWLENLPEIKKLMFSAWSAGKAQERKINEQ